MPTGIGAWSPEKDRWEFYNLEEDWSQADDLAAKMPDRLEQMKSLFLVESARNKNLSIGGGLWTGLHPENGPTTALLKLTQDPRWLGATPTVLAVLHTWTRAMLCHRHVHLLVSAGGWSADRQRWLTPTNPAFLVATSAVLPLNA